MKFLSAQTKLGTWWIKAGSELHSTLIYPPVMRHDVLTVPIDSFRSQRAPESSCLCFAY